jgi:hypothetical protein
VSTGNGDVQVGPDKKQAVDNAYQATVYKAQSQQVSLSVKFQQIAAQFASDDGDGQSQAAGFQAQQLQFDFFAQTRTEELVRFTQKTQAASDGMDGAQKSSYIEASKQVAAKFEFSMSVSGAALDGFTNAADSVKGNSDLFDKFIGFAQQLLDAADKMFNHIMGAFNGAAVDKPENTFTKMIEKMFKDFFGNGNNAAAQLSTGQSQEGQATQGQASSVSIQMEFKFEFSAQVTVQAGQVQQSDPITLDLNGDGFQLTSFAKGAQFDILGNGQTANTAFVTGGDAFLALDRNEDGIINSGKELFGDQNGAANGYEELRKLDGNGDGVINRQDSAFNRLLLFKDNGNGKTEKGELSSLKDAGIDEISLKYANVDQRAAGGNRIAQTASFRRSDGGYGRTADAILNFTA